MKLVYVSVLFGSVLSGCVSVSKFDDHSAHQIKACKSTNDQEISALFEKWNQDLQSGKPESIVKLYAQDSVLLPTLSNKLRFTLLKRKIILSILWKMHLRERLKHDLSILAVILHWIQGSIRFLLQKQESL